MSRITTLSGAGRLALACRWRGLTHCTIRGGCPGYICRSSDRYPAIVLMPPPPPREVFILGTTLDGRSFRPSDWAERLAGAMSSFRPGGAQMGRAAHLGYSPYCVPNSVGDVKCVIVNEALRELEPMAWDFVMNFARDNHLQIAEACLLPDAVPKKA